MQTVTVQSHGLQRRRFQSEATRIFDSIDDMGADVTGANFAPARPVYVRVPLVRTNRINHHQEFGAATRNRESASTSLPPRGHVAQPLKPPKTVMPQLPCSVFPHPNQMGESGTMTRPGTPVEGEVKTRPSTPVPGETATRPCTPVLEMGAGPSAPQPVVFGIPPLETSVARRVIYDQEMTSPSTHTLTYNELLSPNVNGFAPHHPQNGSIAAHGFPSNSFWKNTSIMTASAHPAESVSGSMPAAPTSFLGWGGPIATTSRNLIAHTDAVINDNGSQTCPSFANLWDSDVENANFVLQPRSDHMTCGASFQNQPVSLNGNTNQPNAHCQPQQQPDFAAVVTGFESTYLPPASSWFAVSGAHHESVEAHTETQVHPRQPPFHSGQLKRKTTPHVEPSTLVLEPQVEWYRRYKALQDKRAAREKEEVMVPLFPGLQNRRLPPLGSQPRSLPFLDAKSAAIEKNMTHRLEIERRLNAERKTREYKKSSKRPREPRVPESSGENSENVRPNKRRKICEEPTVKNGLRLGRESVVSESGRPLRRTQPSKGMTRLKRAEEQRSCPNLISSFFGGLVRRALWSS